MESKKTKPQHDLYLDVLKGFAILMVVLGHSLQTFVPNEQFDNNLLFRIIYSFHMPLFMFLAGAAAAYSLRPMNLDFIKRKFYMLVVPFASWYLLGYFISGAYHTLAFRTYIHHVISSPDYGLWFLWVLFLNFVVLMGIGRLTKWFKLYSYLIVWLIILSIPTGKYGIGLVQWHLPFFLSGYLIYRYRDKLQNYRSLVLMLCVIAFPLLALTWHRLYDPSFIAGVQPRLIAHGLQDISVGGIATINNYQVFELLYKYAVAFSGIGFIYWLFRLKPAKYAWDSLGLFGLYTLDIYVMNLYFFRFAVGHNWIVQVISGFIISITLSIMIGKYLLRPIPILSVIFLGGRSHARPALLKK
jgi:fucose 4-O-acetylase-like acetyltransferase